jgi:hypothetical protein
MIFVIGSRCRVGSEGRSILHSRWKAVDVYSDWPCDIDLVMIYKGTTIYGPIVDFALIAIHMCMAGRVQLRPRQDMNGLDNIIHGW